MFSVKHNQSPPSLPLSKARGPPINTGWLGDLSLRLGCEAELNGAADTGLHPDADVSLGLVAASVTRMPGNDQFVMR